MSKKTTLAVRTLTMDDIHTGMFASYDTVLGRSQVEAFAKLTGDISPLHVDPDYGKSTPYNGNIVHGMLTAGHFSTLAGVLLPGRAALLSSLHVDFLTPVPVGATVTICGRVASLHRASSNINLSLTALHEGHICALGQAIVQVRD
jgi:acyl dehydratase